MEDMYLHAANVGDLRMMMMTDWLLVEIQLTEWLLKKQVRSLPFNLTYLSGTCQSVLWAGYLSGF